MDRVALSWLKRGTTALCAALRWRPVWVLAGAGALLAVLIASAALLLVRDLHARAVEDAQQSLAGLSISLGEQADRALQAIELVQQGIIEEIRANDVVTEEEYVAQVSSRAMHDLLRARIAALPQVNAITLIDETGKLRNFSRYWPIPDVTISDRDYFKALVADPALQRFISKPVQNRGDGAWTIYIARKVSGSDGRFLGLVLGAVELQYFERLYRQTAPAPDYVLSMFRQDGVLLVRHPAREGTIGRSFGNAGAALIAALGSRSGVIRNVSPIDGQDRLIAVRGLANYPVLLSISRTAEACLAAWSRQAGALGAAALGLDLGLLGLVVLGARQIRGRERLAEAEAARAAAEERARGECDLRTQYARFGIALDSMTQGLCLFDRDDRLILMNARFAAMHGVPADLARPGTPLADLLARLAAHGTEGALRRRPEGADDPVAFTVDLADGRAISVVQAAIPAGGFVCTHEDVTERRRSEEQIAYLARHDALTGLPNRIPLREWMEEVFARRPYGDVGAVLCLDLDGFKVVNDSLGHPAGDELLRLVARRLRGVVSATDRVARLGGDEFAIVQVGAEQPRQAALLAERVVAVLQQPFEIQGQQVVIGASLGVATALSADPTPDALLRSADIALYQAKAAGRGTWRFFDAEMDLEIQRRRRLAADLRRALDEGQFEVHYQPLVEARSRALRGFEALLRWRHPEHGSVSPAVFIPLAEETGLIRPLGAWVLAQACAEAASWPEPLKIAVNLSPVQFVQGDLVAEVRRVLAETGLGPGRLELEITESVLLQDNEVTLAVLHELRTLGALISMDDFGTGYSSLSYLRSFPFDKIKIDQSFVRNLARETDSVEIVRAVIGLGRALGMGVLAEGVETTEQLDILRQEGCDELQGYLFSRPRPVTEIRSLFNAKAA
ncbi:diguanylate cyclase/phosphodiesterase with PAS/PAC sensor(s) [Methylobacterium sp. 4-46]|uniref:bifunctional diguanylate cyclase/phosphodiesterase n=1 Tax=unclassified Methylobacterium TaxID=2615210 RepID=UPI000165C9AB|nr:MULTISPECIES: EAL domain-containing protein [Methylobacterium]ACA16328.1 diguanylate cyclase/phosphodiesterase with PAS/PAC sensor(s) [Methylobacterium sp. 4-46]WFT82035.1 EAL domain-containing protein [Methylobacterium nodulans]